MFLHLCVILFTGWQFLSRGSLFGVSVVGSLSGGVSVWGDSVWEVSIQGGLCLGDLCLGEAGLCYGDPLQYGNVRAVRTVRILLECILVSVLCLNNS